MIKDTLLPTSAASHLSENTSPSLRGAWGTEDFVYGILLVLVASVIIIENLIVIIGVLFVIFKKKHPFVSIHQGNSNILSINLAVSDFLVGLVSLTLFAVHTVNDNSPRSYDVCVMEVCFIITPCTASVFSMTMISVDRYLSIMHPLKYDYTVKRWKVVSIIGIIWTFSFLLGFAPLMGWNKGYNESYAFQPTCSFLVIFPASYIIFEFLGIFIPQVVVMLYIYTKIFKVSRKHCKQIEKSRVKRPNGIYKNHSFEVKRTKAETEKVVVLTTQSCPVSPVMPRIQTGYNEVLPVFFSPRTVRFSIGQEDKRIRKHSMPAMSFLSKNNKQTSRNVNSIKKVAGTSNYNFSNNIGVVHDSLKTSTNRNISSNKVSTLKRSVSYSSGMSMHSFASQIKTRIHNATHPSKTTKSSLKALRSIMLVIGFFFVMWSPFLIMSFAQLICGDSCQLYTIVGTYLLLLGYCNSAINPIVYTYTNKELKKQLCAPCIRRKQRKIIAKCSNEGIRSTADISDHHLGFSNYNSRLTNSFMGHTSQSSENGFSDHNENGLQNMMEFLNDNQFSKRCHLPNICPES